MLGCTCDACNISTRVFDAIKMSICDFNDGVYFCIFLSLWQLLCSTSWKLEHELWLGLPILKIIPEIEPSYTYLWKTWGVSFVSVNSFFFKPLTHHNCYCKQHLSCCIRVLCMNCILERH